MGRSQGSLNTLQRYFYADIRTLGSWDLEAVVIAGEWDLGRYEE